MTILGNGSIDFFETRSPKKAKHILHSLIRTMNMKDGKLSTLEQETLEIFESISHTEMQKLEEAKRYNLVMEQSFIAQSKKLELEYKMKLFTSYNTMVEKGLSNEIIIYLYVP